MTCPGCGTTAPRGTRRCDQCGTALEPACATCASELPPGASYCPYCGGRVARDAAAGEPLWALPRGERRRATILFSDLWGYTALAESLDPEQVADVMNRLKGVATQVIELFGGTVNQFVGDQVMALFGIPTAHEDDPARAVRAAFELHRAVLAIGEELAPHIGQTLCLHSALNTGLVISQRRDARDGMYGVIGDVINTGARLLLVSGEDEIVVGPETRRAIEPFFDGEALAPVVLRGKALPVAAWRVLRARTDSRFEAARRRGLSEFMGRGHELEALSQALREAARGRARLIAVPGEPGVGKSRLFHEFEHRIAREHGPNVSILHGRCPSYGSVAPYRAFLELVREGVAIVDRGNAIVDRGNAIVDRGNAIVDRGNAIVDRGNAAQEPRAPAPDGIAAELAPHLPVFLHLLSTRNERHPLPRELQGDALREAVFAGITALVGAFSRRRPVALLLEDWHWVDEASERALRYLLEQLAAEPLLVLVSFRPYHRPLWDDLDPVTIPLAPLGPHETERFVASLLGHTTSRDLALRVHRHTEGNPLFIEELCRSLAEGSADERFGMGAAGVDALDVPASIAAMLRTRLDRLDSGAAEVLRTAAVLGEEFAEPILARLVPEPEHLAAQLERLREADLVCSVESARDTSFRFKHALVRDAAYEGLLLRQRRELHGAAARALEAHVGEGGLDAACEQLAHHYAESDEAERAVHFLDRSGDKAVASGAMIQGLEHYRRAVAALDALDPTEERMGRRIDLSLKLANAAIYRPSLENVRVLARSHMYAERLGHAPSVVRTLYWMGWLEHALGRWTEAVAYFERCAPLAKALGDEKLLAQLTSNMGQAFFYAGEHARAVELLEESIEVRERIVGGRGRESIIAYSTGFLALIDAEAGRFERAYARAAEAHALARRAGAQIEGALTTILALVQLYRGDWPACRATAEALGPLAQRIGSTFMLAMSRSAGGYAAHRMGDREEGLRLLHQAVRDLETSEVRMAISLSYACLAEALALEGAGEAAEAFGQKAVARGEAADRMGDAHGHRALALAALARPAPDLALAERRFAASRAVAEAKGSPRDAAITRLAALEHLAAARGEAPKRAELEAVRDELAGLGLDYHAHRAETLLATL